MNTIPKPLLAELKRLKRAYRKALDAPKRKGQAQAHAELVSKAKANLVTFTRELHKYMPDRELSHCAGDCLHLKRQPVYSKLYGHAVHIPEGGGEDTIF